MNPSQVVDAQLAAYNSRDVAAFAATYAEEACIYKPPTGEPILCGRRAIAEYYGAHTFKNEGLRAEILHRLVAGDKVVDHERTRGLGAGAADDGSAYAMVSLARLRAFQPHLRDLAEGINYRVAKKKSADDEDRYGAQFATEFCGWIDEIVAAERDLYCDFG